MSTLPPPERDALIRETLRVLLGCVTFIVVLGLIVYFATT